MTIAFVHVDDYGYTNKMSERILNCIEFGNVNSVSVMIDGEKTQLDKLKNFSTLNIVLHLNLTSITELNKNIKSKTCLENLSFIKLFFARKKTKEVCKLEIERQIEKYLKFFPTYQLKIDGHHHVQVIPWIYKFLVNNEKFQIKQLRIPNEKIYFLNYLSFFKFTFYRNLIAVLILKLLCFNKSTISTNVFAGLLYSGIYNNKTIKKHINKLKKKKSPFEITFHPGFPSKDELKVFKLKNLKYVTSKNRINEYELLLSHFL